MATLASCFSFAAILEFPSLAYMRALASWQACGVPPFGPPGTGMAETWALFKQVACFNSGGRNTHLPESQNGNAESRCELHSEGLGKQLKNDSIFDRTTAPENRKHCLL